MLHRARFEVAPGEVMLVRGPNGAGKSTLLSTIAGVRRPLRGSTTVGGAQAAASAAKKDIGYVTDPPHLFEELTPGEHLELARSLWAAAKIGTGGAELSGRILDGTPDLPAAMLSLGQRKRVGIALALLHAPTLWVLDEPFNGLDASSVSVLRELLTSHLAQGGAVVCATHDEEALRAVEPRVLDLGDPASRLASGTTP
ncbi:MULTISPECIES: heme ABC exporter ATP-binding protein CcmA [Microbacterium]|uniref:Heme ABC exporter ATP-binding protein CcmA n=1 Tax=Microbacterium plantarum TaxID=1816425 RepID=A0ABV5EQY8_9MICO|nr:heme ABC exporter ATP-binding protein CcmA [Microbacterium arborescens]